MSEKISRDIFFSKTFSTPHPPRGWPPGAPWKYGNCTGVGRLPGPGAAPTKSLRILKGKFFRKTIFQKKKTKKFQLKISEKFSQIFRRESPEISAAWRAAFSARNRRKVVEGVGSRSALKTPETRPSRWLKISR